MRKTQNRKNFTKQPRKGKAVYKRATLNNFQFTSIVRGIFADSNTTTAGVGFSFFLNAPTYCRNGASTIGQATSVANLFANEQKTFDEYKVLSLKVSYFPFEQNSLLLSNYTTAAGNTAPTAIAPPWDSSVIVAQDADDSANFSTLGKALNTQGIAYHSRVGNGVKELITMKQSDPVDKQKWLNFQGLVPNVTTPPDPNNPYKLASVKVFTGATGVGIAYPLANTTYGAFILEWVVITKGVYTLG